MEKGLKFTNLAVFVVLILLEFSYKLPMKKK